MNKRLVLILALFMSGTFADSLYSRKYELDPYAGGFFPTSTDNIGRFRNEGIYGFKGGVYATDNIEVGANFGYVNHFMLKSTSPEERSLSTLGLSQPVTHAFTWELLGTYDFGSQNIIGSRLTPYLSIGAGAVTADVRPLSAASAAANGLTNNRSAYLSGGPANLGASGEPVVMSDGDTFFAFSYGGGLKALDVWGPVGFQLEAGGRTLPNFFGHHETWPELTGGLTLTFGER